MILPRDIEGFRVWDTPTPPTLESCLVSSSLTSPMRIATIQTRLCFGLTFFVSFGGIQAIHAHTLRAPYALDTLQQLPFRSRPYALWIYMPIAPEDAILGFGLRVEKRGQGAGRKYPSFLVRRSCGGTTVRMANCISFVFSVRETSLLDRTILGRPMIIWSERNPDLHWSMAFLPMGLFRSPVLSQPSMVASHLPLPNGLLPLQMPASRQLHWKTFDRLECITIRTRDTSRVSSLTMLMGPAERWGSAGWV